MTAHSSRDIEKLTTAALRALSHDSSLQAQLKYGRNRDATLEGNTLTIPIHTHHLSDNDRTLVRAKADAAAMRARFHQSSLHPIAAGEKGAFIDNAEQTRVEALGATRYAGIAHNLNQDLTQEWQSATLGDTEEGVTQALLLKMLIYQKLTSSLPRSIEDDVMLLSKPLRKRVASFLNQLPPVINDQAAYRHLVVEMLKTLTEQDAKEEQKEEEEQPQSEPASNQSTEQQEQQPPTETGSEQMSETSETVEQSTSYDIPIEASFEEDMITSPEQEMPARTRTNHPVSKDQEGYRIYTQTYDEIIAADTLADSSELLRLRGMLDQRLETIGNVTRRHANRFLRKLMSQQLRSWQYHQEEGVLDSAKLPLLVANPNTQLLHKQEDVSDHHNTVVTLLLDNSGSMRGRPVTVAALCAEILARTLETCGIRVEILGFTTVEWKGGKARQNWMENGAPTHPGRLNELRHIVYKSADMPWRRARKNLGLMLKEGILKENIDGEALLWAAQRLANRPESRRILMMISDGAPVDDSTISSNSPYYLDDHLRNVIKMIETMSGIELAAIGIGHDVTRYYQNAVTIKDVDELGGAMFDRLSEMFEQRNTQTVS